MITRYLTLALILAFAGCAPTLIPAGPPIAQSALSAGAFVMPDGAELPYRAWLPQESARAIILSVHGFGDYSANSFNIPAAMFTNRGIAVYAYDQRGFGAGPHPGYWAGSDTLAEDAAAVTRLLRRLHPDTPIYMLGESMGAAVALVASTRADAPPVDGYVLMAPGIRGRATMSDFAKAALEVAARLIPAVGFRGSAPGFSPTDNEDAMRRWSADPLTTKSFRVDAVYGLVNLMDDALLAARRFKGRVLILYGGHDRIVPPSAIRNLLRLMPATPARRFGYYPAGYHLLLRDQQRHVVATDIAEWMLAPDRPLPSGAEEAGRQWAQDRLDQSAAQMR